MERWMCGTITVPSHIEEFRQGLVKIARSPARREVKDMIARTLMRALVQKAVAADSNLHPDDAELDLAVIATAAGFMRDGWRPSR
jgi:hypothetical protein